MNLAIKITIGIVLVLAVLTAVLIWAMIASTH